MPAGRDTARRMAVSKGVRVIGLGVFICPPLGSRASYHAQARSTRVLHACSPSRDRICIGVTDTDLRRAVRRVLRTEDDLEPNIWQMKGGKPQLRRSVRERLMSIAQDFWDGLEKGNAKLVDVILTGSCAGYRWSPSSDLDLHLVVQFADVADYEELVGGYFKARSGAWNSEHDIELEGHPVEIYVQDVNEIHWFNGLFSLMQDKWLFPPIQIERDGSDIDEGQVVNKVRSWARDISHVVRKLGGRYPSRALAAADKMKLRVRQLRRTGLEREGELSIENMTFKALRKMGLIDQLHAAAADAYDRSMSLG